MLASFADMYSGKLGCFKVVKHRIELTLNIRPFCSASYWAGFKVRELKQLKVRKQLKVVIIERLTSLRASPVLFVSKKDGTFCFCFIYRYLNKAAVNETNPLPHTHECIDSLSYAKIYSTMDSNCRFRQTPVKKEAGTKRFLYATRVHIETSACLWFSQCPGHISESFELDPNRLQVENFSCLTRWRHGLF